MRFIVALALASAAAARTCMNATVPVTISARTGIFGGLQLPTTNLEATTFIQNVSAQGGNFTSKALTGYNTTAGTYNISTQFCKPDNATGSSPVVQVLTHGIGFDKTYWDLSFNNYNYSYVNQALAAGYCTLSYDRLGVGNSSMGDPLSEIQSFLEVSALHALVEMLSNGSFPGVSHSFGTDIVAVGHSFGSILSAAMASEYPQSISGLVLTGYSTNTSFTATFLAGGNFQQANLNAPFRFGGVGVSEVTALLANSPVADYLSGIDISNAAPAENLPAGYLVSSNIQANQLLFFYPGNFDPAVLQLAEQTKQSVTVGELLTMNASPKMNQFAGPVYVINGDEDLPFCGGNCSATGIPTLPTIVQAVNASFPMVASSNFSSYVQPMTGHGINLHYNATGAYAEILSFLKGKSIMSS